MSAPSPVESIFFATLGKKTAAERADYLDHACGDDAELRHRVERLLEAHPQAADFLAHPAIRRHDVESSELAEDTEGFVLSSEPERVATATEARPESAETLADECGDEEDNILGYLQPSDKPGSLGRLAHYEVLEVLGKGGFGTVVEGVRREATAARRHQGHVPAPGRELGVPQAVRARGPVGRRRPP